MNLEILLLITLLFVGMVEIVLTWRVWRLERRMLQTMKHFIAAKDFLGDIANKLSAYQPMIQQLAVNGMKIRGKNERLGEFEFELKPSTAPKHIPREQLAKTHEDVTR